MISIGKLRGPDYYLREVVDGAEDYYVSPGEAPGRWTGRAAALLGLEGPVSHEDLAAVFDGHHPGTGEPLSVTRRQIPGFDVTLSAPKSVSLLWALGDRELATSVTASLDGAVADAHRYLEREACSVRRGHAGAVVQQGGGFLGAAFLHRTSRLGDPGLHVHMLVMNVTQGPDGRWTALDARGLYRERYTADAVFQARLRHELARRVGVLFEEVDRHGVGEVAGIPKKVRRTFSQRRVEIEAEMARQGVTTWEGARIATLATRRAKSSGITEEELRRGWQRRAQELDFDLQGVPRLLRTPAMTVNDADLAALCTERQAYFRRNDAVRAAARSAGQGATLDQLDARVDGFLGSEHAVTLVPGSLWSTPEILHLERSTLGAALQGRGVGAGVADEVAVSRAIVARPSLSAEQHDLVRHVTSSGNRLDIVMGRAGAGKTFALDAVRSSYEASGFRMIGTSLSARAARELEASSGIKSQTALSLRNSIVAGWEQLDWRTVLVIDEAAMLGTRLLADLVNEADRAGAKVIAVGDPKQLPEIEAGGLFSALAKRLGVNELTSNLRQRDPVERAALDDLRHGRIDDALALLQRNGNVTIADNADVLRDVMVAEWFQATTDGSHAVMVALRRDDVADLNRRARSLLRAEGRLAPDVLTVNELGFAVGDRVMAHKNRYDLGILNGDQGTVTGATSSHVDLRVDDGRELRLPIQYVADGHLGHGYALTVHKAQGMTCDEALLLGDDALYAEIGYTGLTRGRHRNRLYTVAATDDLRPPVPGDELSHLRRSLAVSQAKTAAIDVAVDAASPPVPAL